MREHNFRFNNSGILCPRGEREVGPDTSLGVIFPVPKKAEVSGYAANLDAIRLTRASQNPADVLVSASAELDLAHAKHWKIMANSPEPTHKYIASLGEELTIRTKLAQEKQEAVINAGLAAQIASVVRYFEVACAAEAVVSGASKLFVRPVDMTEMMILIRESAVMLDFGQGNPADLYSRLNLCYDKSILVQFGLNGEI